MFYYKLDENQNVISVLTTIPERLIQPEWYAPIEGMPNPYPTDEEWAVELATWHTLPITEYSPVWDEAKRCVYARDRLPRYRISNGVITPNPNVQDIDFDQGLFEIKQNGILKWK